MKFTTKNGVTWINSSNIDFAEYFVDIEEIHVTMVNNRKHIIKLSDVGYAAFDDLLDYTFDLRK